MKIVATIYDSLTKKTDVKTYEIDHHIVYEHRMHILKVTNRISRRLIVRKVTVVY